ncbi:MAG: hypothetical protein IRZ00_08785 [Gemmatimonadetes bacterium]|nr:hypothetical protein [Gemmatimonadota bacterium]
MFGIVDVAVRAPDGRAFPGYDLRAALGAAWASGALHGMRRRWGLSTLQRHGVRFGYITDTGRFLTPEDVRALALGAGVDLPDPESQLLVSILPYFGIIFPDRAAETLHWIERAVAAGTAT